MNSYLNATQSQIKVMLSKELLKLKEFIMF